MPKRVDLILRVALALAFAYPPVNALFDPYSWIGYFPAFMHGLLPDLVLLHGFGILELVIVVWLIYGRHVFYPAALAFVMLLAIVLFNGSQFQILFRDLSIALIALALMLAHWPKNASV